MFSGKSSKTDQMQPIPEVCREEKIWITVFRFVTGMKSIMSGDKIMSFKEFCNKHWENLLCFGAAGMMVLIGLVAFICIYNSK